MGSFVCSRVFSMWLRYIGLMLVLTVPFAAVSGPEIMARALHSNKIPDFARISMDFFPILPAIGDIFTRWAPSFTRSAVESSPPPNCDEQFERFEADLQRANPDLDVDLRFLRSQPVLDGMNTLWQKSYSTLQMARLEYAAWVLYDAEAGEYVWQESKVHFQSACNVRPIRPSGNIVAGVHTHPFELYERYPVSLCGMGRTLDEIEDEEPMAYYTGGASPKDRATGRASPYPYAFLIDADEIVFFKADGKILESDPRATDRCGY